MSQIAQTIEKVKSSLPQGVCLVAVSKTHPVSFVQEAYDCGQRDFGENKVQEMSEKAQALPKDIRWHMIGHLQTNKVKYIAPFVHLIHSVDTPKLLAIVDKEAKKVDRVIDCLFQVHVAAELTKFGFAPDELLQYLDEGSFMKLSNVRIRGIMAMATNTDNRDQVAAEFERAHDIFEDVRERFFAGADSFSLLSMGMSGDYDIAVQHGSNIVRVGSLIFGQRDYSEKNNRL